MVLKGDDGAITNDTVLCTVEAVVRNTPLFIDIR